MNHQAYNFNVAVDDEFIVVTWTRATAAPDMLALSRYPELQMRFKYRDISTATVSAMLRDMEVPGPLSKAVLTRISANAT